MLRTSFILSIFLSLALSDSCIRYNFETGNEAFSNKIGVCPSAGLTAWDFREYKDAGVSTQPASSTKFISPKASPSCASSFVFPMTAGGIVEVNVYMESEENADRIVVLGHQVVAGGNDAVMGSAVATPLNSDFTRGWQTLRFTLGGTGTYDGYITIMGMAFSSSPVLVDSFRYIPPGMKETDCVLYQREATEEDEESVSNKGAFWTPLNITIIVGVSLLLIVISIAVCYCCCKKRKLAVMVSA